MSRLDDIAWAVLISMLVFGVIMLVIVAPPVCDRDEFREHRDLVDPM